MGRLELLYVWYGWTVGTFLLFAGGEVPHRWLWTLGHFLVIFPAYGLSRLRFGPLKIALLLGCLLLAFNSLGQILPDLVPFPGEILVMAWDEALGAQAVRAFLRQPPVWVVEVCTLCYSSFYFLPIFLIIILYRKGRSDRVYHFAFRILGGFLFSYMGYIAMPTLPPYRFIDFGGALQGGVFYEALDPLLKQYEGLKQDCMPSGHTMMTLLTLHFAAKYARRHLLWLAPVGFFLILGTLVLRLHWVVDLVVGALFALVAIPLFPEVPRSSLSPGDGREGS
ncbi:MAG TPA: phosphatase PAP2 family protein [Planctomycetes bacterium]|nr:phosphatase PAP2 family protein [Planctomycetota bacterium]